MARSDHLLAISVYHGLTMTPTRLFLAVVALTFIALVLARASQDRTSDAPPLHPSNTDGLASPESRRVADLAAVPEVSPASRERQAASHEPTYIDTGRERVQLPEILDEFVLYACVIYGRHRIVDAMDLDQAYKEWLDAKLMFEMSQRPITEARVTVGGGSR